MKSDWPVGVSELCTAGALAARLLLWSTWEMTNPALHLSRSTDASPAEVAAFAGDPANLPAWAAGLSNGIREAGGRWITDSLTGEVEVRFGPHTDLGILDHDVIFPDGTIVHTPCGRWPMMPAPRWSSLCSVCPVSPTPSSTGTPT